MLTDKSGWTAKASSIKNSDSASYGPQLAINGVDTWSSTGTFTTKSQTHYPWIQVNLGTTIQIKGLVLKTQDGVCCAGQYLEVRIGSQDASGTHPGKKICLNSLCHTTFNSVLGEQRFYCSTSMEGRYVTVQKYDTDNGDWTMSIVEVDVLRLDPVRKTDKEYWIVSSSGSYSYDNPYHAISGLTLQEATSPK